MEVLEILIAIPVMMVLVFGIHFAFYAAKYIWSHRDELQDEEPLVGDKEEIVPHGHFSAKDLKYMPR